MGLSSGLVSHRSCVGCRTLPVAKADTQLAHTVGGNRGCHRGQLLLNPGASNLACGLGTPVPAAPLAATFTRLDPFRGGGRSRLRLSAATSQPPALCAPSSCHGGQALLPCHWRHHRSTHAPRRRQCHSPLGRPHLPNRYMGCNPIWPPSRRNQWSPHRGSPDLLWVPVCPGCTCRDSLGLRSVGGHGVSICDLSSPGTGGELPGPHQPACF